MASKSTKGEILAKFFDDGEYTALFADGAVERCLAAMRLASRLTLFSRTARLSPSKMLEKNIRRPGDGCPDRLPRWSPSTIPPAPSWTRAWIVLTADAKLTAAIAKRLRRGASGGRCAGRVRRHQLL